MTDIDRQIANLEKAAEKDPYSFKPWYDLGIKYNYAGQHEKGIRAFQKVLEIAPKFAGAWTLLGVEYDGAGLYDKAIEA